MGTWMRVSTSPGCNSVAYRPGKKSAAFTTARRAAHAARSGVQRQHQRRVVVGGVAVRDVAAHGAAVAHLRVGDPAGAFHQQRHLLGQQFGPDQLVLGGHGADVDLAAHLGDAAQVRDAAQVDQVGREPRSAASSWAAGCGRRPAAWLRRRASEQRDGVGTGWSARGIRMRLGSRLSPRERPDAARADDFKEGPAARTAGATNSRPAARTAARLHER